MNVIRTAGYVTSALLCVVLGAALSGCSHTVQLNEAQQQSNKRIRDMLLMQQAQWMKAHPGQTPPPQALPPDK
jgi:uncharacterized protein YceK